MKDVKKEKSLFQDHEERERERKRRREREKGEESVLKAQYSPALISDVHGYVIPAPKDK